MINDTNEHVLVGLSSSPSNEKIVKTAAKMAKAFNAKFTALYVKTTKDDKMSLDDKFRLKSNISLAESLGATVVTIYGDDISFQIAEYARISEVTKIVIGRSAVNKRKSPMKSLVTDQLITIAPNVDIYIIPDYSLKTNKKNNFLYNVITLKDVLLSIVIMLLTTLLGYVFMELGFTDANIITIYILAVLITSILTNSKVCWILFSIASVFIFNYLFTAPKFSFVAYDKGYIFTFGVMLIASLITGNIANKMKVQTKESSEVAYRTKILFETNKLLQKAENDDEIITVTTEQLKTLLKRNVYGSLLVNGQIEKNETINFNEDVLKYAIKNNLRVGATTEYFPEDKYLYIPISLGSNIYGIIIIEINETNIDSLENSILFSIIGECAISLENNYILKENEKSKRIAQNEELRGNLLRSISHDLRTPLTSIAGNADNLLLNSESFSLETRKQMYLTIYEESMWLHNLVENILAITKIEEGKMNFNYTTELINDVIIEAIKRIKNNKIKHDIIYKSNYEMVLVKIDAKLIVQVIINLLDNAIKYSNEGTQIIIETIQKDKKINVTISDNGFGIPDDIKPYVFDRFYTGVIIADGRKSLGLGLALCKSIIKAHNGEILVADNEPNGTKITFTLPIEEVEFHE